MKSRPEVRAPEAEFYNCPWGEPLATPDSTAYGEAPKTESVDEHQEAANEPGHEAHE